MPASCGMFGTVCCCITEDCDASRCAPCRGDLFYRVRRRANHNIWWL
ncbi:hypothetical protein BRI6_0731 [plant metagenome]|uniref:Uncharacterized protein n=1 Tax=plant metagenome TaxID=1297885 RepID=A0A484RWC2_9ZZZZ